MQHAAASGYAMYEEPTAPETLSTTSFYSIIRSSAATGNAPLLAPEAQALYEFISKVLPKNGEKASDLAEGAIISWQMIREAGLQHGLALHADLKGKESGATYAPAATLHELQKLIESVRRGSMCGASCTWYTTRVMSTAADAPVCPPSVLPIRM
jgi:hypothetical protein